MIKTFSIEFSYYTFSSICCIHDVHTVKKKRKKEKKKKNKRKRKQKNKGKKREKGMIIISSAMKDNNTFK